MNSKNIRAFKFREGNENDLDSLFENYMWFAALSDLNDPYEGYAHFSNKGLDDDFRLKFLTFLYSKKPKELISPEEEAENYRKNSDRETGVSFSEYVDTKAIEFFKSFYSEHKNDCKILSLSLARKNIDFPAPLNNMLMWSHYTNGFKGFCIEFDYEKLKKSLDKENNIELASSKVDYASDGKLPIVTLKKFMESIIDDSKESSQEILKSFTRKEQSWSYENEVRFISFKGGKLSYDPRCINAIYISDKTPNWLRSSILSSVAIKKAGIKIYLVRLHPSEYKFGFSELNT